MSLGEGSGAADVFLAPSSKYFSYQPFAVICHHSHTTVSFALRLPTPSWPLTEITSLEVSDCIFKLHLIDWPFVLLACVWWFAATVAPPPSSGPHLHQRTRLAACTLTHSCYKLCGPAILWVLALNIKTILPQNSDSSNLQLVLKTCDTCLFQKRVKWKWWVLECTKDKIQRNTDQIQILNRLIIAYGEEEAIDAKKKKKTHIWNADRETERATQRDRLTEEGPCPV